MSGPLSASSTSSSPAGLWANGKPSRSRLSAGGGRRRRVPYLVVGVLLIAVCAVGAMTAVLQVGHREVVMALARPVTVGQVLTAQDLQQVTVSGDTGVDLVPASRASTVLGQPVAFSLPAGTLLSTGLLGPPKIPTSGEGIVSVAVKPGQFPQELAPGATVAVIVVPGNASGTQAASGGPWTATVTSVRALANDQTTVVSLQLPATGARQVAAVASGQLSLVALAAGGS